MPMTKQSGNMYNWVTHTHSHLRGRCPHRCEYCYVQRMRCSRFYQGDLELKESELNVNYGKGNTIFIEHMNDMFAEEVPEEFVDKILWHCREYESDNKFIFQTKNPRRAFRKWKDNPAMFPLDFMMGTTIETNSKDMLSSISNAPPPINRFVWIAVFKEYGIPTFITIEPVMEFDLDVLISWLLEAKPDFINIGADSKKCHLDEPKREDVDYLIKYIKNVGKIEVREKHNLDRLMK